MSPHQDQRQVARKHGRYTNMAPCPCCGKRKALEPAYTTKDGGTVNPVSQWAGQFICMGCIQRESLTPSHLEK